MARFILFLTLLLTFVGSASLGVGQNSAKEIRFMIPIPMHMFTEDATIVVRLWNAEQIERADNNEKCEKDHHMITLTMKIESPEEVKCPEGIEYLEVTPEEFRFPIQTIGEKIEIVSKTIKVGERYKLFAHGQGDKCNFTRAYLEGTVQEETITLPPTSRRTEKGLLWGMTRLGC